MGYAYIVAEPSSRYFKFGFSRLNDESRVMNYKTAFAKYSKLIFPCDNPRGVETAVKQALAPHIQRHDSGRPSEICSKGIGNIHLVRAFNIMCAMTMEAHFELDGGEEAWESEEDVEEVGEEVGEVEEEVGEVSNRVVEVPDQVVEVPDQVEEEVGEIEEVPDQVAPIANASLLEISDAFIQWSGSKYVFHGPGKGWWERGQDNVWAPLKDGDTKIASALASDFYAFLKSSPGDPRVMGKVFTILSNKRGMLAKIKEMTQVSDVKAWIQENARGEEVENKLREFLSLSPQERVINVRGVRWEVELKVVENRVVSKKEFAELFKAWSGETFENDLRVFKDFGFHSPDSTIIVCPYCETKHRARCCNEYDNNNKRKRQAIGNMVIEKRIVDG